MNPFRAKKFVKVNQDSDNEPSSRPVTKAPAQTMKKKEDPEKQNNNVETEPDLRNEREGKLQSFRVKVSERNRDKAKQYEDYYGKSVPLTERVVVNDRLLDESSLYSNDDIELPSPKESDMLIHHQQAGVYEANGDSSDEKITPHSKPKVPIPSLSQAAASIFKKSGLTTVKDPTLEGLQIDDVRYNTGTTNLNSPLGLQVKIQFNNPPDVGS